MGKTRLIEQLLADVQQHACVVLRGYCESYLGAEPLQPFLQMLRGLLGLPGKPRKDETGETLGC